LKKPIHLLIVLSFLCLESAAISLKDLCQENASRTPGSEGHRRIQRLLRERFEEAGIEILEHPFSVLSPTGTASLRFSAPKEGMKTIPLYPFWPNGVRPCAFPLEQLPLVYGGAADTNALEGLPVAGSVLVLEFDCGLEWLRLLELGPKALIFVEPKEAVRWEAEQKFLSTHLAVPRFWLRAEDWQEGLCQALQGRNVVEVKLESNASWIDAPCINLIGFLEGTNPTLSSEALLLMANMDSSSVVPGIAPGAEQILGLQSLLAVLEDMTERPPERTVLFVALDGSCISLAGARQLGHALSSSVAERLKHLLRQMEEEIHSLYQIERLQQGLGKEELDTIQSQLVRLRTRGLSRVDKLERRFLKLAELRRQGRAREREERALDRISASLTEEASLSTQSVAGLVKDLAKIKVSFVPVLEEALGNRLKVVGPQEGQTDYDCHRLRQNLKDVNRPTELLLRRLIQELKTDIDLRKRISAFSSIQCIELAPTSKGQSLGLFPKGAFYDYYEEMELIRALEPLSDRLAAHAEQIALENALERMWKETTDLEITQAVEEELERLSDKVKGLDALSPLWDNMKARNASKVSAALDKAVKTAGEEILGLDSLTRLSRMEVEEMKVSGKPATEVVSDSRTTGSEIAWLMEKELRLLEERLREVRDLSQDLQSLLALRSTALDAMDEGTLHALADVQSICRPSGLPAFLDIPGHPYHWSSLLGTRTCFNAEALHVFGIPAGALATTNDARLSMDTPHDTWDRLNLAQAQKHEWLIRMLADRLSRDTEAYVSSSLPNYACSMRGKVTYFDISKSFMPTEPIPGAVAVAPSPFNTLCGIRTGFLSRSGADGIFRMRGLGFERKATVRPGLFSRQRFDAFLLDPETARILYAPDLGSRGALQYPNETRIDAGAKDLQVVVFPCHEMELYGLVDPRAFLTLNRIDVYGGETNAPPQSYGYTPPVFGPGSTDPKLWTSKVEPVALVYGPEGTRLKMTLGGGVLGSKSALICADANDPYGKGYAPKQLRRLLWSTLRVPWDMWHLDEDRTAKLESYGIVNDRLDILHEEASTVLMRAGEAREEKRHGEALALARRGWGLESKAYPDVMGTSNDVVKGVIFFLAMLFPFAVFSERLLFAAASITKRILYTCGLFLGVFILIRYVHPAFSITLTPLVLLLAFIMLALTIIVSFIVVGKFNDQLRMARSKEAGYRADFERLSATSTAFSLGISNMRRRSGRTLLTCVSLVLLTFTVLSFTSVKTYLRPTRLVLKDVAPTYKGFLFRDKEYGPLEAPAVWAIRSEFQGKAAIYQRSWTYSKMIGYQSHLLFASAEGESYWMTALLGVEPQEWLGTDLRNILEKGRLLRPKSTREVCLSSRACQMLDVDVGDTVFLSSVPLEVVGIVKPGSLSSMTDLDGEPVTPVDYLLTQQRQRAAGPTAELEMERFEHLNEDAFAIVHHQLAMSLGGTVRSVSVRFEQPHQVAEALDSFLPSYGRELFVSQGEDVQFISSAGLTSMSGLNNLVIPMLVAGLIVFNTMMGAVYERTREIGTYSALGLAPLHVASLFVAESCVYANLGGIAGYLLGQAAAKLIASTQVLPGLTLNYSSLSAVVSIALVMGVVVASTLYPSRQAAKLSVPDIQRRWRLPHPEGDLLKMELPFAVRQAEAWGLAHFLIEYLENHAEESHSEFHAGDISHRSADKGDLPIDVWCLVAMAPYDLGVSQWVNVRLQEAQDLETCLVTMTIERAAGDVPAWQRVNRRFLNYLRKQFLIWSTLDPERKASLMEEDHHA